MKNGWNLITIGCILVMCLFCGGCSIGYMNGGFEYSEGFREGTVQKFSHKGMMFKTYEGELAMSGDKNPTMSNIFEFTASDPEIVKELQSLHATENVRLYYKQYMFVPPWRGSTEYFIYKIEKVGK